MSLPITTTTSFLDLNDAKLITGAGLPFPLPLNTTISCEVTAIGVGLDEEPLSQTLTTSPVTLIEDLGNNSRFASDIRVTFNGDGTLNAEVDTFSDDADGGYDSVEWEVVDSSSGGDGGGEQTGSLIEPDVTIPTTIPTESLIPYGSGADTQKAVGSINLLPRMYDLNTEVPFLVTADIVNAEGIDRVEVYYHDVIAVSTERTVDSRGVQGYHFTLKTGNTPVGGPGGPISGDARTPATPPDRIYAKIIPKNGLEKVVYKDLRIGNMENSGIDLSSEGILSLHLGFGVFDSGWGTPNPIGDSKYIELDSGTYYIYRENPRLGNFNFPVTTDWQEVRAKDGADVTIVLKANNTNIERSKTNSPDLRMNHVHFEGVTLDLGYALLIKPSGDTSYTTTDGDGNIIEKFVYGEEYALTFNECTFIDSVYGYAGPVFGDTNPDQVTQNLFSPLDHRNSIEVHNSNIYTYVMGGAREYVNVNAISCFDSLYLGPFKRAGQDKWNDYKIIEQGLCLNKVSNLAGELKYWGRSHNLDFVTVNEVTHSVAENGIDYTTVYFTEEGMNWIGSRYAAGNTDTDPIGNELGGRVLLRGDYMFGIWKSGEEKTIGNRKEFNTNDRFFAWGPLDGTVEDPRPRIELYNVDTDLYLERNGPEVGDFIAVCGWSHPDAFQFSGNTNSTFEGVTVDNMCIHDYRVNHHHQPYLTQDTKGTYKNIVFNNCSFEQPDISRIRTYPLQGQHQGNVRNFSFKYCSFPTSSGLSFRDSFSQYEKPDNFSFIACLLPQLGGDSSGPNDFDTINVIDSVYRNTANFPKIGGISPPNIVNSTELTDRNWDIGIDMDIYGIPLSGGEGTKTSNAQSLPNSLGGTPRTGQIGAYELSDIPESPIFLTDL